MKFKTFCTKKLLMLLTQGYCIILLRINVKNKIIKYELSNLLEHVCQRISNKGSGKLNDRT